MRKIIILVVFIALFLGIKFSGLSDYLSFEFLKSQQERLREVFAERPWVTGGSFFGIYVAATALSIPGAAVLTLAAGAIFGLWSGILIVSAASTLGATLAFLTARFVLRSWIEGKFRSQLETVNRGVEKDGALYLFSLRLIPAFPFFLVNVLMGLTRMKTLTFFIVSQIGMLPGTFVYVNAGTQIATLKSASGIFTPKIIGSFLLLALFPLVMKFFMNLWKNYKVYKGFRKPRSFEYNIVTIGAGSAGLVASYIGATVKAKVALIEKNKYGGDCLNTGCVPSKALLKSAKVAELMKKAKRFGLESVNPKIDFPAVMGRVQKIIGEIEPHDSVERYTKMGVDCFVGEAEIVSPWEVKVNGKILTTRNIILATGASPIVPAFPGLDREGVLTSENIWKLEKLPGTLLVLGGGPIGCEIAQAFQRLGTQVILIEGGERLLPREDKETGEALLLKFQSEGMRVLLGHKAVSFQDKTIILESSSGESREKFDVVFFALGRKARTQMKGFEKLKLELDKKGNFTHSEKMRTRFPNIYVCGDCAGPYQFTHMAAHQAWYAAVNALFSPFRSYSIDYKVVPWCTFTDPEIARVGLSEDEAKEKKIPYEIVSYGIDDLDRAIAESENHGWIKVLVVPGKDKILGATIVGAGAGELIIEFILAMKWNLGLNKILSTIHIYPTFSEASKYLAGNWKKAHKPERILKVVESFHRWRR
jgi:pyruvate/2-oxoglutarate dehydrogenase complex dihydrolipoamide dehydrogenase (E3) component/uncharacterized membrane protein YdjX (TVP38/TMEM64 family)